MTLRCDHDGCNERARQWTITGYDDPPTFDFCTTHAAEFGFCLSCGNFIGGTEDVFKTGRPGICFECFLQEAREMDRIFDDNEWEDEDDV